MPELPEVEVVRRGLETHVVGRIISQVQVLHQRAIRRHFAGPDDLAARLTGRTVQEACRRGKYLWLRLDDGQALLGHLGMSGQLLMQPSNAADEKHLRVRINFIDAGAELRFVDQRTFGGLAVTELVDSQGALVPLPVAHIARDPLDVNFDRAATIAKIRRRRTEIKRALLDQSVISGVGNIYADESLWRSQIHWAYPTDKLSQAQADVLLSAITEVFAQALDLGGTSFDSLYVNVNGQSGYFDRSLAAYGQEGKPCQRCGTAIIREPFMNRSSYSCPKCQPSPNFEVGLS